MRFKTLMSLFSCSLSLAPALAHAQTTLPPQKKSHVDVSTRFVPLVKGEVVQTLRGGGYVRQVSDQVTCTFVPVNLDGYTIRHYYWSGLDFGDPAPDSATVTGVAHDPGAITVSCVVEIVAKDDPNAVPFKTDPYKSKTLYVVGGPLALGVSGGINGTPQHDPSAAPPPGSPAGTTPPTGPWYVEYFGFDPSGTKPSGAQNPQNGTVNANGPQPATVTYEWAVDGPLKRIDTATGSTSGITVGATAGSAGSPIRVKCTYKFDNGDPNDPVTGSCPDDSLQTPDSNGMSNPSIYEFDAHMPKHLETLDEGVDNPTVNNGMYHNDRDYKYQLYDDGSAVMGYVYIVERFTGDQPNNYAGSLWPLSDLGIIVDSFWINLDTSFPVGYWVFDHFYFAGTTDTSKVGDAKSGILVLTTKSSVGTQKITNYEVKPAP